MDRSRFLLGVMVPCCFGIAGLYYWWEIPRTPRELYLARCSACHEEPDLTGYQRHELAPLVDFMRTHNGARRIISDSEARTIIGYLEAHWREHRGSRTSR